MHHEVAYQPPPLSDPHETDVYQLHDYLHSHSTKEHKLQKETKNRL